MSSPATPDPKAVEAIFIALLDIEPAQRDHAVERLCGDNEEMRREVRSLLRFHHGTNAGALDRSPMLTISSGLLGASAADQLPPTTTAAGFTLKSVLGSGGMGVVYVAQQHKPSRTVALKVIRPASATGQLLRRFEHEAELLARLQHPGIAQVYETGVADFGHGQQPFIAMELVYGLNLLEFARRNSLGVRERLDLVARICDAMQHAHQRGVIHRDLKPANILVMDERSTNDSRMHAPSDSTSVLMGEHRSSVVARGSGVVAASWLPKILDFGVARAVDADLGVTVQTSAGQLIGTLPYMSPEQVAADHDEIDTRSDVYALGIIAYQLLSGRLPHDLTGKSITEVVRVIRDDQPQRLGAVVSECRGDIETIVAKAMESERDRRYQSAAELAADIRRFLHDEPIEARPATTFYSLRKFVKRHRVLVTAGAAVAAALALGIAGTTRAMLEARQQRDEALRNGRIAQAVNDFLNNDLLSQADPSNQPNRELKLRDALDYAAASVAKRFADEPLVEAAIRTSLGRTYQSLGEFDKAETQIRGALAANQKVLPANDSRVLGSQADVANVLQLRGVYDEAESMCRRVIETAERELGVDHNITLHARDVLALTLEKLNRYQEAEPLVIETHALRTAKYGEDSAETVTSLRLLGLMYERNGKFELAEETMERAVSATKALLGEEHPQTLSAMNNLALVYFGQQRYAEAQTVLEKVYERSFRVLGPRHNDTLAAMSNLATMMMGQQQYEEAEKLLLEKIRVVEEVLGPTHSDTLNAKNTLAGLYHRTKRFELEEPLLRETLDVATRVYGETHLEAMVALASLARMQLATGRLDEANANGVQAYSLLSTSLGEEHPITQMMVTYLVRIAKGLNDADETARWESKLKR